MQLRELLETGLKTGEVEEAHGEMDQTVTGLAYDSREVNQGNIFFAVPGARTDGHDFARQACERGAAAVVVERKLPLPEGVPWIRAGNVRRLMGRWAALYFAHPSRRLVLVGITGTNGKTTVCSLVEAIFSAAGMVSGAIGTINYRYPGHVVPALYTTPEAVDLQALLGQMVEAGVQSVAMEVSSHALAMERVRGLEFDVAVFTNLSRDHLDFHGDMEDYFSTKGRLFTEYLPESSKTKKFAVICGDDPRGEELLAKVHQAGVEVVSYGRGRKWDIHPLEIDGGLEGLRGKIGMKGQELEFSSSLIGEANLENIMGAVGVGFAVGLPVSAIAEGIARLASVPGRLERIENDLDITVLVDYAHTPDALEKVLQAVRSLAMGKLIALFGCGGDRDRGKRPLMGEIAGRLSDRVVLTSDNPRTEEPLRILEEIEEGIRKAGLKKIRISKFQIRSEGKGYWIESDRRAAIRLALRLARAGDLVLIAGKGHEDYQVIGSKRIRFDDREVAREELKKLSEVSGKHA